MGKKMFILDNLSFRMSHKLVNFLVLLSTFEMTHSAGETWIHKFMLGNSTENLQCIVDYNVTSECSVTCDLLTLCGFPFTSNCRFQIHV